ncbi:DUF2496 domain-containing protein [Dongshaea marina]|nr:DUF2496 domain-containing protein [Dongshaea marina]
MQLAVDLIELLEVNEIEPQLALAALKIVTEDFEYKIRELNSTSQNDADS